MLEKNNQNSDLRGEDEYVLASSGLLDELDVSVGEQIRAGSSTDSAEYESALYTVVGESSSRETVGMSKSALDRLGLKKDTTGFARGYAPPHPEYETRDEADTNDEYVEVLVDDGQQSELVACAAHGGWIEYRTDKQSKYVAETLDVTEWSCVGYNSGGGAYDRWHITSTDINPNSFPELRSISDRQFTHAVSFHGFSDDGIAIGGGAADALKEDVRDAIDAATDGRYEVYLTSDSDYDGDSAENFVNWITADDNGIQIEQGWDARVDDWENIADAVAGVYSDMI
jgi:phage replication-related protein YjqB (UPF0714/DUF867 family)